MSQQDQGPVQPLESAPNAVSRGVLDRLIGAQETAPAQADQVGGYSDPIAADVVAAAQNNCPNCFSAKQQEVALKDGSCPTCGFSKEMRLF